MRILLLAPHPFFQVRGTPLAERALLEVLGSHGHELHVLTYHLGEDVQIPNCRIHRLPSIPGVESVPPGLSRGKLACDAVMTVQAIRLSRRLRPDLIHAVEDSVFMAMAIRRACGIPFVYDMDSSMPDQLLDRHPKLAAVEGFLRWCEGAAVRESLGVLAVCRALQDLALGHAPEKLVGRLEDVSLVDPDEPSPASPQVPGEGKESLRKTIGRNGPIVLYVGNLAPYQGLDLLLKGFALAAPDAGDAQLVVVGGSARRIRDYTSRADRLELAERVHFVGPRPVTELGTYLRQADVLVSPRLGGTNTPMKIYSYLASGRPILATRLPTHTQVLDERISLLVDPDPEDVAAGLRRLLGDPGLRRELGEAGRARARREYTRPAFRAKLLDFYAEVERRLQSNAVRPVTTALGGLPDAPHAGGLRAGSAVPTRQDPRAEMEWEGGHT